MTRRRSLIRRREPIIALEPLRYRGRTYKEGDHLDRRRVHMSHSKLVSLIRKGICILAKDLDADKLAEYGYVHDTSQRYHLRAYVEESKDDESTDDESTDDESTDDESQDDESQDDESQDDKSQDDESQDDESQDDESQDDESQDDKTVEVIQSESKGWYNVLVNNEIINDKKLRKAEAEELAKAEMENTSVESSNDELKDKPSEE